MGNQKGEGEATSGRKARAPWSVHRTHYRLADGRLTPRSVFVRSIRPILVNPHGSDSIIFGKSGSRLSDRAFTIAFPRLPPFLSYLLGRNVGLFRKRTWKVNLRFS